MSRDPAVCVVVRGKGHKNVTASHPTTIEFTRDSHISPRADCILLVSYGSGAGSDAFSLVVTDLIEERRARAPFTRDYIARRREIDYAMYARYRQKLAMA